MKRILIAIIMLAPLATFAQEARMNAAPSRSETERLIIESPANGEVFMREANVKGQAGNNIKSVTVINLTAGNTNSTEVHYGKWMVKVPLAIARTNQFLILAEVKDMEKTIPAPYARIWVLSRLDFSLAGKVFMVVIWLLIIVLNVFAFSRIFRIKEEKIVEPLEIDTED